MIMLLLMVCLTICIQQNIREWEKAYYVSIIIWTSISYALNEVLSVWKILEFSALMAAYIVITSLVIIICIIQFRKGKSIKKSIFYKREKYEKKLLTFVVIFFCFILGMSLVTIPYNWDSQTYHLTRIAYWEQNKTVAHYATNNIREVTSPVLAEFINLQVYILNHKSDVLLNLLQTTSYITNTILVWSICKKLKISKPYSYLAILLFLSMPISFGEALSTQVDQFATVWLLLFVYFILDLLDKDFRFVLSKNVFARVLLLGACIAFGYLTKPSVLFAILGFAIWLLCVSLKRKDSIKNIMILLVIAGVEIVLFVMPEIARNLITFSAISAPIAGAKQLVGTLNPLYLLINGMKNFAMNLPNIYFPWIADICRHGIYWLAYKLHVDINDWSISEGEQAFSLHSPQTYGHDTAVNPIVAIFLIIVMFLLIRKVWKKEKKEFLDYFSFVSIAVYIVFCMALRWEYYVTRYMLSYLALLCPVIAGNLDRVGNQKEKLGKMVIPILVFSCFVELSGLIQYHGEICLQHMDANSRLDGYFTERDGREQYKQVGTILNEKKYQNLGLYFDTDTYEYPIFSLVNEGVRIEAVNVSNATSVYLDPDFIPEFIIVIDRDPKDVLNYNGREYTLSYSIDDLVYVLELSLKNGLEGDQNDTINT